MTTAVTFTWRLSYQEESLTNETIYTMTFVKEIDEKIIRGVMAELKRIGKVNLQLKAVIV